MSLFNDRTELPAPVGAIRERREIIDLVIEARKEKKAIRVWTVTQSGHLSCFYITSRSRLHKPEERGLSFSSKTHPGQWYVDTIHDHSSIGYTKTKERWFKHCELMGSYNIESFGGNCHYAFTSKIAATRYSQELMNDKAYMAGVKAWHSYCSKMMSSWGRD